MSATIATAPAFSRNHPAVMGAIKRANIDPTDMTDAQLRSALMASIATEVSEPAEPETFIDRVFDKLDSFLFGPTLVKVLVGVVASLAGLTILSQIATALAS